MSSVSQGPPPPVRPRSAFHTAARASWMVFLAFLAISMIGRATLPSLLADLLSIATVFAGFALAVVGLCGIPRHGRKGLLAPALIGLVLNGLFLLIAFTNASAAARRTRDRRQQPPAAVSPTSTAALARGAFHIVEAIGTLDGGTRYIVEAAGTRRACSFEIIIAAAKPAANSIFTFASASLVRRPNSDCTAFLAALAPQLGFKGALPTPQRVARLDVNLAVLGSNQSRSPDHPEVAGSFSSRPPGHWTATKLFLADGEGEVFLNLNSHDRIGEFSLKDEDDAQIVVTEFAKVLLPEPDGA